MTNSYINCKFTVLAAVWYVFLKYCTSNKFDETRTTLLLLDVQNVGNYVSKYCVYELEERDHIAFMLL